MAEHCFRVGEGTKLVLVQGDLTAWEGDAIVNAANERMLGGGGVDGAIHRAAGDELYDACLAVTPTPPNSRCRCPIGEARITPGFDLPAKFVIHTVGPIYKNDEESAPLLSAAHRSSLLLAKGKGLKSIAFCAISTGVYGYPIPAAAAIAMQAVEAEAAGLDLISFVLFSPAILTEYTKSAERLFPVWDDAPPHTPASTPAAPTTDTAMATSPAASPPPPTAPASSASEADANAPAPTAAPDSVMDESSPASDAVKAPTADAEAPAEAAAPTCPSPDATPSGFVTGNANSVVNSNMDRDTVLGMNPTAGAVADAAKERKDTNLAEFADIQAGGPDVHNQPSAAEPNVQAQAQGIASETAPAPPTPDAAAAMIDPDSVPSPPHTPTPVQPLPTGTGQPTPDAMNVPTKEESERPIPSLMPEKTLAPGEEPKQVDSSTVGERKRLADKMFDA